MICVSIGRGRHKQMKAEHGHLVEQGARLVELRLDYIRRDVNLKRLIDDRPCPVIITCRRERDGGKWAGTEQARMMLLRAAIAEGVEYVDLEEDVAGDIPRYGKTKRIVSLHDFRETPDDLETIWERMAGLDADIVKISTMAHSPHDNLRMLRMVKKAILPTVGICMGEIGTPSRILAGKFGAPFTYATFHHERTLAPGQLSFRQMTDVFQYDKIDENTDVYGVAADPIGHSLSPIIHNAAFRRLKLNKVYVPFRVPREDIDDFLFDCREMGVKGLSITIPHKESVLRHLAKADSSVRGIGAANTIIFDDDQALGYNTDFKAAMDSLDASLKGDPTEKPFAGKAALVLGAGGVSRAIAFGLVQREAQVHIASRTHMRSQELAERLGCRAIEWDERYDLKPDIIVNGTPIGMHPNVDESPYDRKHLKPAMTVFDTVYNPEQTLLLKEARQVGCTVITGVEMFVRQAALQFRLFTGQTPPVKEMREDLKRAIGPHGRG
ncbi:MAG: shikimate dehydrogenase [Pirellulaceae bacterium]